MRHTKKQESMIHTQENGGVKRNCLKMTPDVVYSRERFQNSCYKYVQRTKEKLCLKKLKESTMTMIQCIGNLNMDIEIISKNQMETVKLKSRITGFPGGSVVKNLPANAGATGSSSDLGRSHMPRGN